MYNQRIDMINNEIANLERLKQQVPQAPIMQNFQFSPPGLMKYANNIEDVKKEIVFSDTPFFSKEMSVLWIKNASGDIKAYELNEIIEKDEKDIKIEMLEAKLKKLEGDINEYGTSFVESNKNKESTNV
jgi:hypothetical protein